MHILSIDTSSSLASVALVSDRKVLAESVFQADRCLSARLMPEIERLLALSGLTVDGIDLFAAAIGPGSFTGVRAGVATIQGLSLATGKPCTGFSALTMLAMNLPLAALPVCALLDARKNEVYAGLYDCSTPIPKALIDDCVMPPGRLLEQIRKTSTTSVIFAGEGALRYHDIISDQLGERAILAPLPQHAGHASNGALLALEAHLSAKTLSPAELLPIYIRPSEAELARSKA